MKSTKKSLLLSTLSLIMCVAMLLGTTYAWFTDSVTSGKNKIIAGNLDVELYANGNKVDGDTKLFSDVALWEPGAVAFDTLQVKNVGNLALKYQLSFLFENETKVDGHGLSEVLKIGTYAGEITDSTKREDVIAGLSDVAPIASFAKSGKLAANTDDTAVTYVVYWEPGDNDNLYNMNNEKKGKDLSIDFYVKLVATQDTVEADSFDKNYDIEAPWLGGVADVPAEVEGVITINSAEELAGFAKSVNSGNTYSGKTIKLGKDIDLNNISWTPISVFNGTFDGQNHTVLNLVVSGEKKVGLFGQVGGTVQNLNVDGAKVQGINAVGTVCGLSYYGDIINCTVKNATVTSSVKDGDDGDKVGGVVGRLSVEEGTGSVKNCTAENVTVQGLRQVGGVLGGAYKTSGSYDVSGNTAKNSTIIFDKSNAYGTYATMTDVREVIGTPEAVNSANTATNVTILTMEQDGLVVDTANKTYYVSNANGLMAVRAKLDDGSISKNDTVKLDADIDMTGKTWDSVECHADAKQKGFKEFDGQGYTVSNLTINGQGLFSRVATDHPITIKNVTFDKAKNTTNTLNVSLVTYQVYSDLTLDNVKVINSTFKGAYKVAPLVATVYNENTSTVTLTVKDCTVENCTVEGTAYNFDVCGMVAWVNTADNDRFVFEGNNTVKDVQLIKRNGIACDMFAKIWHDGETAHDTDSNVTVTNVNIVTP